MGQKTGPATREMAGEAEEARSQWGPTATSTSLPLQWPRDSERTLEKVKPGSGSLPVQEEWSGAGQK